MSQKIEHLQDAFPFFSFSIVAFSPPLVGSSTAISSVFASRTGDSASTLTGDAFEPISSRFYAYSTTGFSAACLAASSAFFLSASTL